MKYFLAIIGGGPAGYTAAEMASKAGKDVIIFEQNALGGTCLNVGCIPTKTLLYSAKQYYNAKNAAKYGVSAENVAFDYTKIVQRKTKVVRKLVAGIKQKLNNEHCTLVMGAATVLSRTDDNVLIACGEEQYEAENLLICTGSTNFVPPIPGVKDNPSIWDSTNALDSKELPQSMIIVGGGVIGMEFATLYHELGVPVTVIEAMPTILPNLDQEIVTILLEKYRKAGIQILTDTKVTEVQGNKVLTTNGEYEAEHILISVGRRANMQGLDALNDIEIYRGGIVVDEFMKITCKYGIPYFANYVNSDLSPEDAVSMCCRLRLDLRELRKKSGGFFGSGESTGSVGVVTINCARLGYVYKNNNFTVATCI